MQAGATGRHRPFPEKRASITRLQVQAGYTARTARAEVWTAIVRLRLAAPRKAEDPSHLRADGAAVSSHVRRGSAPQGLDRREPAEAAGIASRQRRLPDGLRLDPCRSAATGQPQV